MDNIGLQELSTFLEEQMVKLKKAQSTLMADAQKSVEVEVNGIVITCYGEIQPKDVECGLLYTDMEVDRIEVYNPLDLLVNGVTLDQLNEALRKKLN